MCFTQNGGYPHERTCNTSTCYPFRHIFSLPLFIIQRRLTCKNITLCAWPTKCAARTSQRHWLVALPYHLRPATAPQDRATVYKYQCLSLHCVGGVFAAEPLVIRVEPGEVGHQVSRFTHHLRRTLVIQISGSRKCHFVV